MEGWSCELKEFPLSGVFLVGRELHQIFPFAKLYTITGMVMAADFTTAIWVEVVATVGGRHSLGQIHWHSWSWGGKYALDNYPYFISSFGGHSDSSLLFIHLGSWGFSSHGLLFWGGMQVLGCVWVWSCGLGLVPSLSSNSRYVFIFQMREGYG